MGQSKWEAVKWKRFSKGMYNKVYIDPTKKNVLKIQIPGENENADTPERSVRLWNMLNPDLEYPAFVVEKTSKGRGWICPFIEGTAPTDKEISDCVIDIFNKTGRIVMDASAVGLNFIKTAQGKVVCIDVGFVLEMDSRDKVVYKGGATRRKSIDSLISWRNTGFRFPAFFNASARAGKPQTANTIQALLFIKEYRPNIVDASYLKQDLNLINRLALAYATSENLPVVLAELDRRIPPAQVIHPVGLKVAIDRCVTELKKYINSRGTVDKYGIFTPSFATRWFRDSDLTLHKVKHALDLINLFNKLYVDGSVDDMTRRINNIIRYPKALASNYTSGLGVALNNCLKIIQEEKDKLENEGRSENLRNP